MELNEKGKPIFLVEENAGEHFCDAGVGSFMKQNTKSLIMKEKVIQWHYVKIKEVYLLWCTIKRAQRQLTKWEKIISVHVSEKGLIQRM